MPLEILSFAAGVICLQLQATLPPWPWFAAGGLLCLPALRFSGWLPRGLAITGCFLLGIAWAAWRAEVRLDSHLAADWEGRDVEIVGVVAGLPQPFSQGARFEFVIEEVLTPEEVLPARVMLSWYRGQRDGEQFAGQQVRPGERWRLTVRLKRPHGNANPGGFDYEAWLLERGIRATGYVRANPPQRLAVMVWQPGLVIERLRDTMRAAFNMRMPVDDYPFAGVLVALAIGDQNAVNGDLWTVFNRTGTTHLMSISGLHVTMFAALFGWLVNTLWRRISWLAMRWPAQKAGLFAAAGGAFFYALLAGFAVPAQRTLYMLLVAALAMASGRIVSPGRILGVALLVVLLVDPWAVLAVGFWLSFGAVGALLLVSAANVGEGRGWRTRMRGWGVTQWVATLASLPVLLLVFQQFSLVSPLANALAIPVISFVVTPLALLGAVLPWWPVLALGHGALEWLMRFLVWCAAWPVWQMPAPPWWLAVIAACGVLLCLLPRGVPGRFFGLVWLMPALFWPPERPAEGEAWVDVLDVGQGLASVVRTRGHTLIYDPGPLYSAESDAGQRVVVPYLRWLGVDHVDELIVTHRDSDHSGGTASVRSALPVGRIRSSVPGLPGERCAAGQRWRWDGVDFAILHPAADASAEGKSNHQSCVLALSAGGRRMLLTSDIEAEDETALLARDAKALAADVLLVPHHGSRTSSTPAFLAAVGAPDAVIPVGYRNRYGHPKDEVLARYEALGTRLWRSDRDGAIRVHLGEQAISIHAWRRERVRYWQGR